MPSMTEKTGSKNAGATNRRRNERQVERERESLSRPSHATAAGKTSKAKSRKTLPGAPRDTYMELIGRFRLVPIRSDTQLAKALAMIDRLLRRKLDRGAEQYLDALSDLVEVYEDKRFPVSPPAPPAEVLDELMRANGLSQSALAKLVGIAQSTISDILRGERSLNIGHVTKLAKHFNVSPEVFLSA